MQSLAREVGAVEAVLIDSGFYSQNAVQAVEQDPACQPTGTTVYAAMERTAHHRSVSELERKPEPEPPPAGASVDEVMRYRLAPRAGKQKYERR